MQLTVEKPSLVDHSAHTATSQLNEFCNALNVTTRNFKISPLPCDTVYNHSAMYFLSSIDKQHAKILGAKPRSGEVYLLRKNGELSRVHYGGYLYCNQSRFIPGGQYVKVAAMALCETDNIHSCKTLLPGHYLVGFYIAEVDHVFVLADDHGKPIVRFCPRNYPPR